MYPKTVPLRNSIEQQNLFQPSNINSTMNSSNLNNQISLFHTSFTTFSTIPVEENDSSFHIFSFIRDAFSDSLSVNEQMQMQHHLQSYEKSLTHARNGNLHQSIFWINYINQYPASLPLPAMKAMESLYFAMRAYHWYASKSYEAAVEDLNNAIYQANSLANEGLPVLTASCYEQSLNTCRVHFTSGELVKASTESGKLLLYINTGHSLHSPGLADNLAFRTAHPGIQKYMLGYVTNSILARLEKISKQDDSNLKDYYSLVLSPLLDYSEDWECPIPGYRNAMSSLHEYYKGNPEKYLKNLLDLASEFSTFPTLLQKRLLSCLLSLSRETGYADRDALEESASTYSREILKAGKMIIEKEVVAL
jgi:hypothetical protein